MKLRIVDVKIFVGLQVFEEANGRKNNPNTSITVCISDFGYTHHASMRLKYTFEPNF